MGRHLACLPWRLQSAARQAYETGRDFRALIAEEPAVKERLSAETLAACFDYDRHLKGIERVYERLGI